MINIVKTFWEKEQEYVKETQASELAYYEYLVSNYGKSTMFYRIRAKGSLPHIRFIKEFRNFLNDDETFLYINYWLNKHPQDDDAEDFASDILLDLRISEEVRQYIRIKRKEQQEKMYLAIDKENSL